MECSATSHKQALFFSLCPLLFLSLSLSVYLSHFFLTMHMSPRVLTNTFHSLLYPEKKKKKSSNNSSNDMGQQDDRESRALLRLLEFSQQLSQNAEVSCCTIPLPCGNYCFFFFSFLRGIMRLALYCSHCLPPCTVEHEHEHEQEEQQDRTKKMTLTC